MSKHFKPDEVLGYLTIDGKRVTYLKMGVKRNPRYNDHLDDSDMSHINPNIIALQRYAEYLKKIVGLDDFQDI